MQDLCGVAGCVLDKDKDSDKDKEEDKMVCLKSDGTRIQRRGRMRMVSVSRRGSDSRDILESCCPGRWNGEVARSGKW